MGLFFIGGINGVGKSSLVSSAAQHAPLVALDGSTELMKQLHIPAGRYEYLRQLPNHRKDEAWGQVFKEIAHSYAGKPAMITGHYVKILEGEITPSYGGWYQYCDGLILIVSSPSSILSRINLDETKGTRRGRNLFKENLQSTPDEKIKFLHSAQALSMTIMEQAAREFGVPSYQIRNSDGRLSDAEEQLSSIIEGRC